VRAVVAEVKKRHPGLPVFLVGTSRSTSMLASFDWAKIRARLLFVHHVDDGCAATPYLEAARVGRRFPLVSVEGGSPAQSGPCEPFSFLGREADTIDAIAAWMLGRPFAKDVR
jgi:hypothetical protein